MPRQVGPLDLGQCDLLGYIPCEHQATQLRIPIAGTGVALSYSSEWQPGRLDRPQEWNPSSLGLGGWTLDVLQRYDAANGILLGGDGSWRFADALALPSGEIAVPSFDGRLAYVFDAAGRNVRTVDAILGVNLLRFRYDEQGRLLTADGSVNNSPVHLVVERSLDGTINGLTGAGGAFTRVDVDGAGHLGSMTHPDGGSDGFFTDGQGLVSVHIDPVGGVAKFDYDDAGRLAAATDPDGVATTYAQTQSDTEIQVIVSRPLVAPSTYRARLLDGAIERTYLAPGGPTTTVVESFDGHRAVSLPDGTDITIGAVPDPRWGVAAPLLTPIVEQRSDAVVRRTEIEQIIELDPNDPLRATAWSRTTTANGDSYVEQLDTGQRALTFTDPAGRTTEAAYDDEGRLVTYNAPGEPHVAFTYDEQGLLIADTRGTGTDAATTTYAYGKDGLVTTSRPDGTTVTVVVDAAGRVVRQAAGEGSSLLSTYDAAGRVVAVRPGGALGTTLGYSKAGRPTALVPPVSADDPSYQVADYDEAGRLLEVSGPTRRLISMAYDGAGRLGQVLFDRGQLAMQYDPISGRVLSVSAPDGVTTSFSYVGALRSGISWSGPVTADVRVEFDPHGRIISESIDGAATIESTYDPAGELTGVDSVVLERDPRSGLETNAALGVVQMHREYDPNGRLAAASVTARGAPILTVSITRDVFGRISTITETSPHGEQATAYQYDTTGHLASVTVDGTTTERNAYDAAGNRVSVISPAAPILAEYDAGDRLRRWGPTDFGYDVDGSLASRTDSSGQTAFDFDDLGTLRAAVLPDGRHVEYVVDSRGLPIGRMVDGAIVARYLYRPDGLLVAEEAGSGALVARFAYDDSRRLVSIDHGGRDFFVVTDHLGSPRLVIDPSTGEVVQEVAYDAWGRVINDSNPGFQPFGFAGGLRDADTGLVHFGARDYDPTIGRWLQSDPLGLASGQANLYVYVADDPVNLTDRSGLRVGKAPPPIGEPPPPPVDDWSDTDTVFEDYWHTCDANGSCSRLPPDFTPDFQYCPGCPPGGAKEAEPPDGAEPPPAGPPPGGPPPGPDPGKGGGGFTCVGICFPPGGGLCIGLCSSGDPHVRTADRLSISFQGAGEYLMAASDDASVVIQARQEPPFDMTQVTITTAVTASVAGDRVGVYLGDDGALSLHVNGGTVDGLDVVRTLPHGGSVTRHGTSFVIEWPDGSRLTVDQRGIHLDYGFTPDPAIAPTLTGLMGTPDGDVANDLVSRDGSLTLDPNAADFLDQLHGAFGDSWRITQDESLFDYGPGESTASFTRSEIPTGPSTPDAVPPDARATAEALCRAVGATSEPTLSDCIVDVGLTGDSSYAASAAAVEAATAAVPPPPGVAQPIASGDNVVGMIGDAEQIDQYTFAGSTGQTVKLDSLGQCMGDMSWELLGPATEHLFAGLICNDLGPWTIRADGTYVIKVYSHGVATGLYAFQLRLDL